MEKVGLKPWKIGIVGVCRTGSNRVQGLHGVGYRMWIVHNVPRMLA